MYLNVRLEGRKGRIGMCLSQMGVNGSECIDISAIYYPSLSLFLSLFIEKK